jgi:hypothetical protein
MALPRVLLGYEHSFLMYEVRELSTADLLKVIEHVNRHAAKAKALEESEDLDSALFLIELLNKELKERA